ncbi:glycosyltransferase family 4 protein [Mycolicibacterium gilvum]|nr:glycosyltransferase family 4 protein [Mycolicibacterium gilvum]
MQDTDFWVDWNIRHIATHCDGSALDRVRIFALGYFKFVFQILAWYPDLVHVHSSSYGSFARKCILSWTAIILRVPVIIHVHGSEFHNFFDNAQPPIKWVIRRTLTRASTVIALGATWAERLQRIAPNAKIALVPNAIRLEGAVAQDSSGPVHVVFLGRVSDRKGTFLLLESWAKLVATASTPTPKLTIAGDGEVDRARELASALGIRNGVDIRGWMSPTEAQELLATAHVLVLPSLNEGQPMAILEAMARGICVVASNSGGIPEMLGMDGGVLVDPINADSLTDALRHVTCNAAARAEIGALARQRISRHFNVDQLARRLDDLYHDVLKV